MSETQPLSASGIRHRAGLIKSSLKRNPPKCVALQFEIEPLDTESALEGEEKWRKHT